MTELANLIRENSLVRETSIEYFDILCTLVAGHPPPSTAQLEGDFKTELFVFADEKMQEAAINLYPFVRTHEADEFLKFMFETYDGTSEDWIKFSDDTKFEALIDFTLFYQTKTLVELITKEDFSPMFFTGFYNGIAVLCIQDQKKLRDEILEIASKLISQRGITLEEFILLDFGAQLTICAELETYIVAEIQCMDSRFPKNIYLSEG
jgi:hypothetical protein